MAPLAFSESSFHPK